MTSPLLEVRDLVKTYPLGRGRGAVRALDGVSLELAAGEMLALVGESGSGKSTLLAQIAGLETPDAGVIEVEGRDLRRLDRAARRDLRRRLQMIFQDPYESLDPRQTIGDIVAEPLVVHRLLPDPAARRARVEAALATVGLEPPAAYAARRPAELSGGQRQRVAIASALAVDPALLLADEPVSMLDVSVRAEVLNLLARLRRERAIAVLMVTHDLATAAAVADRIAVMYLGRIVESGPARAVLAAPAHPYTRALRDASPVADPARRSTREPLAGETPNAAALPTGCRFHPRCPRAEARCRDDEPGLVALGAGRAAACWFPAE
ncbi:MAG: ABC transporter ATP-binding protein [Thermoanaerobaculia bacterium]|nr:ABC transporter ATP-binding protein [Thermoanaerobaculia bacterium]